MTLTSEPREIRRHRQWRVSHSRLDAVVETAETDEAAKLTAMRKQNTYKAFQDRIFDEIDDLEKHKSLLRIAAEVYGLTMVEVRTIYKPGMDGDQLEEAMRLAGEEKKKQSH